MGSGQRRAWRLATHHCPDLLDIKPPKSLVRCPQYDGVSTTRSRERAVNQIYLTGDMNMVAEGVKTTQAVLDLAAGEINEDQFASWLRTNSKSP